MLRDNWNFHNDIAIALESIASQQFGSVGRPVDRIYDADAIEQGSFVEVMILVLRDKTRMDNQYEEIDKFIRACKPYLGINGNNIPKEIAQNLFDWFQNML